MPTPERSPPATTARTDDGSFGVDDDDPADRERRLIEEITTTLAQRHQDADRRALVEIARRALQRFAGVPVIDFVPILATRLALDLAQSEITSGPSERRDPPRPKHAGTSPAAAAVGNPVDPVGAARQPST